MKRETCFYLARHGETEWNRLRKLQGRLDSPLTNNGTWQAENMAQAFAERAISLIVSSPLERAKKTAAICQQHLNIRYIIEDGLTERDFGEWQTRLFDELATKPDFELIFKRVTDNSPPKGESGIECAMRLTQTLRTIAHSNEDERILVVTHGDAIRCFMADLSSNIEVDAYSQFGNGSIFLVVYHHQTEQFIRRPLWESSRVSYRP